MSEPQGSVIVRRDPPLRARDRDAGPTTPLDRQIMGVLADGGQYQLREVVARVGNTTHHVHARLRVLVERGLVTWVPIEGGPRRGPGASVYMLARAGG